MKVGSTEIVADPPKKRKLRAGISTGRPTGGSNGGGGDGPDDGKFEPFNRFPHDPTAEPKDKTRITTTFLLGVVVMTFGGLLAAYFVLSINRAAEWQPFALPFQVWISTAIIIASSFCYHFAFNAVRADEQRSIRNWLIATSALGGIFISSQIIAWYELVQRGFYMYKNPYAGFFYILTVVHAVHVIGGIIALGAITLRTWYPTQSPKDHERRENLARSVGWYWHLMGILWLVILGLLAFWK